MESNNLIIAFILKAIEYTAIFFGVVIVSLGFVFWYSFKRKKKTKDRFETIEFQISEINRNIEEMASEHRELLTVIREQRDAFSVFINNRNLKDLMENKLNYLYENIDFSNCVSQSLKVYLDSVKDYVCKVYFDYRNDSEKDPSNIKRKTDTFVNSNAIVFEESLCNEVKAISHNYTYKFLSIIEANNSKHSQITNSVELKTKIVTSFEELVNQIIMACNIESQRKNLGSIYQKSIYSSQKNYLLQTISTMFTKCDYASICKMLGEFIHVIDDNEFIVISANFKKAYENGEHKEIMRSFLAVMDYLKQ